MKKIFFSIAFVPFFAFCNNINVKDGLYYGYWVYKEHGAIKEYGVLANNPRKEINKYILTPVPQFAAADEIYIQVKDNIPVVYFYHENVGAELNTIGWGDANFTEEGMVISANTIRMVAEDSVDHVYVGEKFSGKRVGMEKKEVVPFSSIDDDGFKINCNQYLDINGYRDNGLPDYSEPDPEGRKGIGISYPATVFSVLETGICALFFDDDIVPQIKNGWIQFRRIN